MSRILIAACIVFVLMTGTQALSVTLDYTSGIIMSTIISEQADVTVPAIITFNVTNITVATQSAAQTVSATNIVLAEGKSLRIEMVAIDWAFTPPPGGGNSWYAGDITWNAASWTNGTGSSGTLHDSWFRKIADSNPNVTSLTTSNLVFTLAAKSSVTRAGDHILQYNTWKFSSF